MGLHDSVNASLSLKRGSKVNPICSLTKAASQPDHSNTSRFAVDRSKLLRKLIMSRQRNKFRPSSPPAARARGDYNKKAASGGNNSTVQRWAKTKLGISMQAQGDGELKLNPKAQWIQLVVRRLRGVKASAWSFRDAWSSEYRRDALWIQIPIATSSKLAEIVQGFRATQPIGFFSDMKAPSDAAAAMTIDELFPNTNQFWLPDLMALVDRNLVTFELSAQNGRGRDSRDQTNDLVLSVGIAWQSYMDVCLYQPVFAWPPVEPVHTQMQRVMLWVLKGSRQDAGQWSYLNINELDRLYDEFVGASEASILVEELEPPLEQTCVEFERNGVKLGYDPFRACFVGLL